MQRVSTIYSLIIISTIILRIVTESSSEHSNKIIVVGVLPARFRGAAQVCTTSLHAAPSEELPQTTPLLQLLFNTQKRQTGNSYPCNFQEHALMSPRLSNCKPDTKLEDGYSDETPVKGLLVL